MKKVTKRFLAAIVSVMMLVSMCATSVFADSYTNIPTEVSLYADSKGISDTNREYVSFYISGLKINQKSVKTSASWLKPYSAENSENKYNYYYFEDGRTSNGGGQSSSVSLRASKTGTANVTYKIGTKSYTTKVTVRAYVNPVKTAKFFGCKYNGNTNVAALTKTAAYNYDKKLKVPASKTNQKITIAAIDGWKIKNISFDDNTKNIDRSIYFSNGVKSASLPVGNIVKGNSYRCSVSFQNVKNGGTIYVSYNFE